ncbi:3'(2'),5'-bisphosphate nucleotidase CysQ [Hoeflea poritis]|uniref:3'(2'),5'-bisphosphate nucleotidase CysQ n=1 Tax=Hoeflea poritis TaxID=2993659 RepID=A0ABT4VSF7_9HYPH|nr:3'(2'),5'-bisphosphate nucleotidase CysQ [Hoeflea poritis]MDA4847653.1 3'(2'),5'-bisphosphate nucleotidase CysQ [Hoeflea poritis]
MQENEERLADLTLIREAALKAGDIAMGYFRKNPDVWYKGGSSPVTEADISVNTYLNEKLSAARPDYGWLSEENEDDRAQRRQDRIFVVDPIDGTRAFVNGEDVWCVSIAVVEAGVSLAGVLVCPARGEVFEAVEGAGATKNGKKITVSSVETPRVMSMPQTVYRHLPEAFAETITRAKHIPSLAYRIAMVADGRLDATLVKPGSHDWDLAAADLILRNAGGALLNRKGEPVRYNKKSVSHGLLIAGPDRVLPELKNLASTIDL